MILVRNTFTAETFKKYMTDPKVREKAKGYTDLWTSGNRRLLRVIGNSAKGSVDTQPGEQQRREVPGN